MARSKKAPRQSPEDFWKANAEELPRADIELVDRNAKRARLYRVVVFSCVFAVPVMGLSAVAVVPKLLATPVAAAAHSDAVNSPTKGVAMTAVQAWLNQSPSPLPGGQILSWDGAQVQATPSIKVNKDTNQTTEVQGLELNTLTLVAPNGALFTTQVQVGYSPIRGAQVIGQPTLIPRAPDDKGSWPNLTPWPDFTKVGSTDAIKQAASAWVKAFTSGDPDALRLAVGDTSQTHSYVPLVQATATDVKVGDAAARKTASDSSGQAKASEVVAQVSFAVTWAGQPVDRNTTPARITYDVLIDKADTASPVVVAWGGAGSGESLAPFGNAVDGRKITTDGLTQPGPAAAQQTTAPQAVPQVSQQAGPQPSAVPSAASKTGK